ncbi:Alpha/Beta hydrolase protein [Limtongia smithiae]|uniref:Alpha/Beta hydrolase protein n=1 Tax=Limtongia smithiae TaxID=1125753 RepID=UPI0034CF3385
MSELQKAMLKGKIAIPLFRRPRTGHAYGDAVAEEEEEEEETEGSQTGTYAPSDSEVKSETEFALPARIPRRQSYTAVPWSDYWATCSTAPLTTPESEFTIYSTPPHTPLGADTGPVWFIFHHGAGSSALTFSLTADALHKELPHIGVAAHDARGHGMTRNTGDDSDMSLSTLARDFVCMTAHILASSSSQAEVVFVGHSLGGAVATEAVVNLDTYWPANTPAIKPTISGLVVLDVVEGSAMEALGSMLAYLRTRPQRFRSVSDAIRWHVRSHTVRNGVSAQVSVPGIVRGVPGSTEVAWITDLAATEPFWAGWFAELSGKFLRARAGRMLVLAGTDRLDRELTVGQMQGKYQLEVFGETGHFVQEDAPQRLAMLLAQFLQRNRKGAADALRALNFAVHAQV